MYCSVLQIVDFCFDCIGINYQFSYVRIYLLIKNDIPKGKLYYL
jgi:hypothetical protein